MVFHFNKIPKDSSLSTKQITRSTITLFDHDGRCETSGEMVVTRSVAYPFGLVCRIPAIARYNMNRQGLFFSFNFATIYENLDPQKSNISLALSIHEELVGVVTNLSSYMRYWQHAPYRASLASLFLC